MSRSIWVCAGLVLAAGALSAANPPIVSKDFGSSSIAKGTVTFLTFTIFNPNGSTLTNVGLVDNLPVGLAVAALPGTGFQCTSPPTTFSPAANATTITLAGATILGGESCTFTVNIVGNTQGHYTNTTQAPTSTEAGPGNPAQQVIDVIAPPDVTKNFSPAKTKKTGIVKAIFTIKNPNGNPVTLLDIGANDSLPTGLVVAPSPNVDTSGCPGGIVTNPANPVQFHLPSLAQGVTCTFSIDVLADGQAFGNITNTIGVSSSNGGNVNAQAQILIVRAPTISKLFSPAGIPLNGNSTLVFTVRNPNTEFQSDLSGIGFSDTLPAGIILTSAAVGGNCPPGSVVANTGTNTITLTGVSLGTSSPSNACQFTVSVSGTVPGKLTNVTGTITSTEGGPGNQATGILFVYDRPVVTKSFTPSSIALSGSSTLTITIQNPNPSGLDLSGVTFTDALAGMVVANSPALVNGCGGSVSAIAGSASVSLTGGAIAAATACTISLSVKPTVAGVLPNSTGAVSTNESLPGTAGTASLTVFAPPVIKKTFNPQSVPLNTNSTLTITITNPNTGLPSLTGISFTDTLVNMTTVGSPINTGCGGTASATATSLSLSNGTLASQGMCTITIAVTAKATGILPNTVGPVHSTEGGDGNSDTVSLTSVGPPQLTKAFSPASVPAGGSTTLSFLVTNANPTTPLSGISFTDALPGGLVATTGALITNTCSTGTITASAGSPNIALSALSLAGGGTCTFSLTVTAPATGSFTNVTSAITSVEGGTGTTATATLNVLMPLTLSKAFGASSVAIGGTTSLTITVVNPNAGTALTGITFTDTLPAGLVIATPNGLGGTCAGSSAVAGLSAVSLTLASLPAASSCTVIVNVTGTTSGVKNNSVIATSTNGGTSNTATATLNVFGPPTIHKAFSPSSVPVGTNSTLTITITNPNLLPLPALTGIGFTDNLVNMITASSPVNNGCGGTASATANSVSLVNGVLASGASCTITISVTAQLTGSLGNTTSTVHSNEGGDGTPGTGTLISVGPPTLSKNFNASAVAVGGTSTLSFTITNPNPSTGLTGIGFTDLLPGGVTITNGTVTGTCPLGTITAPSGTDTITVSGLSLAQGASCTFSLTVTAGTAGTKNNTTTAITSVEGGTGSTATATLFVMSPPILTKAFGAPSVAVGGTTSLTLTLSNPNTTVLTGVSFTDTLPTGLVVATPPALGGTCPGVTAAAGSTTVSVAPFSLPGSGSCTVIVNVTGTTAGQKNNSVTPTSTNGGDGLAATATLLVFAPPTTSKVFNPSSVPVNTDTTLIITISNTNPAGMPPLTGVSFTDNLVNMKVSTTPALSVVGCGGAPVVTATAGSAVVSLTGGTILAQGSCVIQVKVTPTLGADLPNTTGPVHTVEAGDGTPGTGTLTSVLPPNITKNYAVPAIVIDGTTTLSFVVSNPNPTATLNNVTVTDTLPAGLEVSVPPPPGSCFGGSVSTTTNTITFSGATIPAGQSCSYSVTVVGKALGTTTNTATASATNSGNNTGTATLKVTPKSPVLTKSFGALTIPLNGTTTLSFVLTNPNSDPLLGTLTGVAFTDSLPAGLVVATPNGLSALIGCGPGAASAVAGSGTVTLTGATVVPGTPCTFSLTVKGTVAGPKSNTTSGIHSNEAVDGAAATASLEVIPPPDINKSFLNSSIMVGATTTLTFTVKYPPVIPLAGTPLTGVGFSDTLPDVITVASPNNKTDGCGGGIISAVPGSQLVTLVGATLNPGQICTYSVSVTGKFIGTRTNSVTVQSTNGGVGNTSTADITVFGNTVPPTLIKSFSSPSVLPGGTVGITLVLSNPNSFQLTGLGFTDILPAGLLVSNPNGLSTTCNGTTTAVANSNSISLNGASLAANASCVITVSVTASGNPTTRICNVTSEVISDQAPKGAPGEACLTLGATAIGPPDGFQVRYAANLNIGDSVINLSNSGALSGFDPFGQICVNTYTFSPDEQLVSCCTCLVTPNALNSLSVKKDLIANTLTPAAPSSVVIKLLASLPQAGKCDAAAPLTLGTLAPGLVAWGSTLHVPPYAAQISVVETPFTPATLSAAELQRVTSLCSFIKSNGSGFGICASCRAGGL